MPYRRKPHLVVLVLALLATGPAAAQFAGSPDQLKRYTECMALARKEPLRALPMAEKWMAEGANLGARHCVALATLLAGRSQQAAPQFEAIARDMGLDRPGLRGELWGQAGQAWMEAGLAERAAAAQSMAIDLRPNDAELRIDRGLSYAAMQAWPRAISDFDEALRLHPNDVEVLVLRAAAWRNAKNPAKALADAERALRLAPEHSEALLERGFAHLARGEKPAANADFNKVLKIVPPGSDAAQRAQSGLRGDLPAPPPVQAAPAASAPATPAKKPR
jgi:tetratricopeptide (TPR) repeat protein